jgi:hypothetical protein
MSHKNSAIGGQGSLIWQFHWLQVFQGGSGL